MKAHFKPGTGTGSDTTNPEEFVLNHLKHPVCIIGKDGLLQYSNQSFQQFFKTNGKDIRLDWEHPFFPEYRKRLATAYLNVLKGSDKHCFAIINTPDGLQVPLEIYLFPLFTDNTVTSILAMLKIVDDRLLSFDRSTLSLISEENFKYDSLHYEYSPVPIIRINDNEEIIKCSQTMEGFLGYTAEEILSEKQVTIDVIFHQDYEKVKKAVHGILNGEIPFQRLGEIRATTRENDTKVVNLTIYPILQDNEISAIEIVFEDITKILDLKNKINAINSSKLFSDITKGFLHSLNNSINVILSKTQMLMQITEKESVMEGIQMLGEAANDITEQIRRVQSLISDSVDEHRENEELLVNIIEDAIEFSRMQFKVEDKEHKRTIRIERKYFSSVYIKTDTRMLREIIISIIIKLSRFIHKAGIIHIILKDNNNLELIIKVDKETSTQTASLSRPFVNIFSGINISQAAEKINIKVVEEESSETYSIKAILPGKIIRDNKARTTEENEYKLRDMDIIIAEDESHLQKILFDLFDKMGNRVFMSKDGIDALEEFKRKHYDLVITDYGIPGITGLELAARVKEINEDTVTVLLSGWSLEDIDRYSSVIDAFIAKPFKLDELINEISSIFNEKRKS